MDVRQVTLTDDYITLGQLLKYTDVIQSGGMARPYLAQYVVYVNDEEEQRRGRKLYPGDVIEIPYEDMTIQIQASNIE